MQDLRKTGWWKSLGLDGYFGTDKPEPFIELCVLSSMVAAGADGSASAEEYDHIVTMVTLATNGKADRDMLDDLVNRSVKQLEEERGMDALIEDVSDRATAGAGVRKAALAFAVACASSDGTVDEPEVETLKSLAEALKLPNELEGVRASIAKG
jgi:tellurite resistance protein